MPSTNLPSPLDAAPRPVACSTGVTHAPRPCLPRIALVVSAAAAALAGPGCVLGEPGVLREKPPPRPWSYVVAARRDRAPVLDETLAVEPLVDARDHTNDSSEWRALIPFVSSGTGVFRDPTARAGASNSTYRAAEPWDTSFTDVVPRAVAEEIDNARVFRCARAGTDAAADYVLSGELAATTVRREISFYGLSVLGPLLALLGPPHKWIDNELDVRLTLRRRGVVEPLWTYDLRAKQSATWNVYDFLAGRDIEFLFDHALAAAMPGMLVSLEDRVRGIRTGSSP